MRYCHAPYPNGLLPPWGGCGPGNWTGEKGEIDCPPLFGPVKECVKKYQTCYKLYKISTFRLFKVCSFCGREFDYYRHRGCCPHCY